MGIHRTAAIRCGGAVAFFVLPALSPAGATTLVGDVTVPGSLVYPDAVTLAADVTLTSTGAGLVSMAATVDGGYALVVRTAGGTLFGGTVGGIVPLRSLATDAGGYTRLAGNVITSAAQQYADALLLDGNVVLTSVGGGSISAWESIDGMHGLQIDATGPIQLGRVGANLAPTGLQLSGTSITQTAPFTVEGSVGFHATSGAIVLSNAANRFNGSVAFSSSGSQPVFITTAGALSLSGGSIGDGALTLAGASINGGPVVQAGFGAVTLSAVAGDVTLASGGNDLRGPVSVSGESIVLADSSDLEIASLDFAPNHDVSLKAGGLLMMPPDAINVGTAALELRANGGALALVASVAGADLSLAGRDGVILGADVSASGPLAVGSANGAVAQVGGKLLVGGNGSITTGSGAISLTAFGNDFTGPLDLAGGPIQVVDANALRLGSVAGTSLTATSHGPLGLGSASVSGNLIATSDGGAISQTGALSVAGTSLLDAGTATVVLDNAGNDFGADVSVSGGDVTLVDANDLDIAALASAANADVVLRAGGALQLPALPIAAGTGNLVLQSGGASLQQPGSLAAHDITLAGRDGMAFTDDVTASGNLALASTDAALTQVAGRMAVAGTTSIDAGVGAVSLTGAANDFTGAVTLAGGDIAVSDANALFIGTVSAGNLAATSHGALGLGSGSVGGNLAATSNGGAIVQAGPLGVAGTSLVEAGSGAITLANAGNDFGAAASLHGGVIQVADANALTLGAVTGSALTVASHGALDLGSAVVSGPLVASSNGGAIGQSGAVSVVGSSQVDAGTGSVLLTHAANDFAGTLSLAGGDLAVTDANALSFGAVTGASLAATSHGALALGAGTLAGNLSASSHGGAIAQAGPLAVAGTSLVDAGTGAITLADAGNDFSGAVTLAGGTIQVADASALALGAVSGNALTATSHGALDLGSAAIAGNLVASSNGGSVGQSGALSVAGTSRIAAGAGAVVLTHAGNDFTGALDLAGGAVQVEDANALSLGSIDTGALAVTSHGALSLGSGAVQGDLSAASNGGAIGQAAALAIAGTSHIDAGAGAVTLSSAANDFVGAVDVAASAAALVDANDLELAGAAVTGGLQLRSGGRLSISGAVAAGNVLLEIDSGVLDGSIATPSGSTTLVAGTLEVAASGSLDAVTVGAGTTLGGVGNSGPVDNTGTVSPGTPSTPYGSLQAASYGGGGTLRIALDAASDSSASLAVSGQASLAGTLLLDFGAGIPDCGRSYTVLSAAGISGTFDAIVVAGQSFTIVPTYAADRVTIAPGYCIGGTVDGLSGSGLTLQLEGSGSLPIATDGPFVFPQKLADASSYVVRIATQPSGQECTVSNGSGTIAGGNVDDVAVSCIDLLADLQLAIDDGREFAAYGGTIDYVVTLRNRGRAPAIGVALDSNLSPALDGDNAHWICDSDDGDAQCTGSGVGPLHETDVVVPVGSTITWIVTVPVRPDSSEPRATMGVAVAGAQPPEASDVDQLVLLRDGFDDAASTLVPASAGDPLRPGVAVGIGLPATPASGWVRDAAQVDGATGESIVVQVLDVGAGPLVRLLLRMPDGWELAGGWSAVSAPLALRVTEAGDGGRSLQLEGVAAPAVMPLGDGAATLRVHEARP